jgi:hypothetical protein
LRKAGAVSRSEQLGCSEYAKDACSLGLGDRFAPVSDLDQLVRAIAETSSQFSCVDGKQAMKPHQVV